MQPRASKLTSRDFADDLDTPVPNWWGRIHRLRGDSEAARREFGVAHRLFTEMGAAGNAEQIARRLELIS